VLLVGRSESSIPFRSIGECLGKDGEHRADSADDRGHLPLGVRFQEPSHGGADCCDTRARDEKHVRPERDRVDALM
jgi:hypothetical protein